MAGEVKSDWVTDDVYSAADANAVATAINVSLGAAQAYVTTEEGTSSTSYTDLATTTDSVTATIGASGLALVAIYGSLKHSTLGAFSCASFALSGANTLAADDAHSINFQAQIASTVIGRYGGTILLTSLNAGNTTFKMKYRTTSGTANFSDRRIAVIPL